MNTEIKYAGFWMRFLATILDSIWLYGIIYGVLWYMLGSDIFNPDVSYTLTQFVFEGVIPFIVVIAFWRYWSATPAKMLLRMKIVDSETHEPTFNSKVNYSLSSIFCVNASFVFGLPVDCLG